MVKYADDETETIDLRTEQFILQSTLARPEIVPIIDCPGADYFQPPSRETAGTRRKRIAPTPPRTDRRRRRIDETTEAPPDPSQSVTIEGFVLKFQDDRSPDDSDLEVIQKKVSAKLPHHLGETVAEESSEDEEEQEQTF